jgi:hypothetical protein
MQSESRLWTPSSIVLTMAGAALIGVGLYFIFLRPPLLPEDIRYMALPAAQLDILRPPLELWLTQFRVSRSGNVWDNATMESFFSSLKTARITRRMYRTRDDARADVFDYIERFYNPKRRHSTIGYLSLMEFEQRAGLA